jgi:ElaB/YqjD/DUF883 family membrane-anchored ribosome-binding protein
MDTENIPETGRRVVSEADRIWRENPVPVVLGALGVGLLIGVLVRSLERDRTDELQSRLASTESFVQELIGTLTKASKKGYKKSASALHDVVEKAADVAHDAEDDYIDPAAKWFRGLWKKCCS